MGLIDDYLNRKKVEEMAKKAQEATGGAIIAGMEYAHQGIQYGKQKAQQAYQGTTQYLNKMGTDWNKIWQPWPETKYGIPQNFDEKKQLYQLDMEEKEAERKRKMQQLNQ